MIENIAKDKNKNNYYVSKYSIIPYSLYLYLNPFNPLGVSYMFSLYRLISLL